MKPTRIQTSADKHKRILGYKQYLPRSLRPKKKALLSYLPVPVLDHMNDVPISRFSNSGLAISWAKVLNELNYVVDIIDWQDQEFEPKTNYDLMVFHGGKNFTEIYRKRRGEPIVIYFSTGNYWRFSNKSEDQRIADFELRHGTKVSRDRYVYESEDPVLKAASGIIALGDESIKESYSKFQLVLPINNASYPDKHFDETSKDFIKTKNNFLFFAGSGNIHKGLDLLIDAFKDLNEHLYIVTVPDKEVLGVFNKELKLLNIHLVGEVNLRSPEFYEVMDKCAFVILPSCSEGQAGSVVEAMNQGLIPIVSKETRLAVNDYGIILKTSSIAEIKKVVCNLSSLSANQVEKMSKKARKAAVSFHSPTYFEKELSKLIKYIVSRAKQ